jgi:hypothetical protein
MSAIMVKDTTVVMIPKPNSDMNVALSVAIVAVTAPDTAVTVC